MQALIQGSLTTQEQARIAWQGRGSGRRALVIGGRGKMGRWFADFLASQGFTITVADPAGRSGGLRSRRGLEDVRPRHDLIVVATPIRIANEVLGELAAAPARAASSSTSVR